MKKAQIECPCIDCESRCVNCHSQCKKYIDYAKALKTENYALKTAQNREFFISSHRTRTIRAQQSMRKSAVRTQHLDASIVDTTFRQQEVT